jgi:hypothetical protein
MGGAPECKRMGTCLFLMALAVGAGPVPAPSVSPDALDRQAAIVGAPTALEVLPASIELRGPRAVRQLIVSARYADGSVRDLTSATTLKQLCMGRSFWRVFAFCPI